MNFKTGDLVMITKIFYPMEFDNLYKKSTIRVNDNSIYLIDLGIYINKYCITKIDEDINYTFDENYIYSPKIIDVKKIKE